MNEEFNGLCDFRHITFRTVIAKFTEKVETELRKVDNDK